MTSSKHITALQPVFELFRDSPPLRRMYYAGLGVAYLFAVSALIHAVRWW